MSEQQPATGDTDAMSRRQIAFMVGALLLAVVSFQLNASMLAPAIRDIETELGAGSYAAMSTYFYLAGAVANVVLIRWSDFVGRKRMILGALVVVCIGTLLCVVSTSLTVVLIGRVLQGVSNINFGLAFLIMRERLSAKTFGVCSGIVTAMTGGVAGADGLLGGWMADNFGYQSIFMLIGVVGLIGIVVCAVAVPSDDAQRGASGRMDWAGAALIALGVAGLNLFFAAGSNTGWVSPLALGLIVAAMVALVALVVVERRIAHPLVDVDQMRSRQAWPLVVVIVLNMASFMVVLGFVVPYIAEDQDSGFGFSGLTTALFFLTPAALIQLATAPLFGRLAVRIGFVTLLRGGLAGSVVVVVLLTQCTHSFVLVAVLVAVMGVVYMAMVMTAMSALAVLQAPEAEPGSLPGISNAAYGVGSSIGFAWAGPIVGSGTASTFPIALWTCVGIGVVSLGVSMVLRPRTPSRAPSSSG